MDGCSVKRRNGGGRGTCPAAWQQDTTKMGVATVNAAAGDGDA